MPAPRHPATTILRAVQAGRITPERAGHYAALAARGEDISVLDTLQRPHGDTRKPEIAAHSWNEALTAVSDMLSQIDWTDTNTQNRTLIYDPDEGEISQEDWLRLFGQPPSASTPTNRWPQPRAARPVSELSEDELYSLLFTDGQQ